MEEELRELNFSFVENSLTGLEGINLNWLTKIIESIKQLILGFSSSIKRCFNEFCLRVKGLRPKRFCDWKDEETEEDQKMNNEGLNPTEMCEQQLRRVSTNSFKNKMIGLTQPIKRFCLKRLNDLKRLFRRLYDQFFDVRYVVMGPNKEGLMLYKGDFSMDRPYFNEVDDPNEKFNSTSSENTESDNEKD